MEEGIAPVHTTLVPDINVVLKKALMENINHSLNDLTAWDKERTRTRGAGRV
jgi:hypothetical protein